MSKYFWLLGMLLFSTPSFSQVFKNDSVKTFIDTSLALIEKHSIYTENLELIKRGLYDEGKTMQSVDEIAPLYEKVFRQLNDYHGNLKYKGKTYGWNRPADAENLYLKEKIKENKKVFSKIIDEEFAYISIRGNNDFGSRKLDSIANDIVAHINTIHTDKIKGWIIDLRLNTGGNMYPILLGLKDFLGNDIVFGGFENARKESTGKWEIRNNKLIIDAVELERKHNLKRPVRNNIPIVILTSCYTASAGEMVAVSFIGRHKTYIVGEPTANYTTAVEGFKINATAGINLSTDYIVDRNLKVYKNNVTPDVEVTGGDNLDDFSKDNKIKEALKLLRK